MSSVPEKRRHVYFYSFLLLYTLLVHTLKNCDTSAADVHHRISAEVIRLIDAGAVAKNLY